MLVLSSGLREALRAGGSVGHHSLAIVVAIQVDWRKSALCAVRGIRRSTLLVL